MKHTTRHILCLGLLTAASLTTACHKTERPAYVLTSTGRILGFDTARPTKIKTEVRVTGLGADESLVQLQYRPANDLFYGLSNQRRLYTVDPKTGATNLVRATAFISEALVGPVIDFNPVADRLRVIASEQNLRVDPNDGTLAAADADVFFDGDDVSDNRIPQLAALAYDRNQNGAEATTLFALDVTSNSLVRVGSRDGAPDSPNSGRLFTVAEVPVSFTSTAGFDIEPDGDTAYAALAPSGAGAALYRIDLKGGNADLVDPIDDGDRSIISLTIGPKETGN